MDQSGFVKNRGLTNNVMNLMTALEYCELKNIPTLLVSFDFEKAFDRVEWNVLYFVMLKFNFLQEYIDMIKVLYYWIESCTINNGYSSKYIQITRSLRQGCPLSSSLFLLIIEVLGQKL